MDKSDLEIATPITLPCGLTFPNRLVKAALAEGWSDNDKLPSKELIRTYGTWADGGWGMVLTGNVQVDMTYLGTPEDNAFNDRIPRDQLLASWREWARATNRHGTPTLMQINHPGRQSMIGAGSRSVFAKSIAPSPLPLRLGDGILARAISALVFGTPREMTVPDIQDVIARFAETAKLAHEAGFAGVQIHAAHGYLLAQFLSASSNQRADAYGGTARNRARVVVEVIQAVRAAVPKDFCVGIKLNSVDHQSPLELQECIEQLEDVAAAGVDFLEISGGAYENPTMVLDGNEPTQTASTLAREAFFLDFAKAIREKFSHVPLVVTGGFRTRQGMEAAVREGACDMVGIGRPAVLNASLPKNIIFNAEVKDGAAKVYARRVAVPWIAKKLGMRAIAGGAETTWYQKHMHGMLTSNL
ncbi:NADH oxidase [Tolypocladium ophioglossoides CBS 100239]|uniref:NADH oxidase n=1 Tax=Tolypocladium ophioglossoides (strain CBS 100239) TaxID=1163406 RepID=A0A0L0NEI6_TOLOC|nr:NADH oxidase [Tolypocladium ophioglossoides CBS 100239]